MILIGTETMGCRLVANFGLPGNVRRAGHRVNVLGVRLVLVTG